MLRTLICLTAVAIASLLFAMIPVQPDTTAYYPELPIKVQSAASSAVVVREQSDVDYGYPADASLHTVVFARDELLRGKLLLIDSEHPIPDDAPTPNTLAIASKGKGVIPVKDLAVRSCEEMIDVLYRFFYDARCDGVEGLVITRGTLSEAEQLDWQIERLRIHAAACTLDQAVERTLLEVDNPAHSEHQQPYAVDIRTYSAWNGMLADEPLAAVDAGRYLIRTCQKYGLIQRYPQARDNEDKAYHFRYVGLAHAAAMNKLNLTLEEYLALLHEKQAITIQQNGAPKYLIVCRPMRDGYASFELPDNLPYEASCDNTGYAVVACTYP